MIKPIHQELQLVMYQYKFKIYSFAYINRGWIHKLITMKHYIESRIAKLKEYIDAINKKMVKGNLTEEELQRCSVDMLILTARIDELKQLPIDQYPTTTGGENTSYNND